MPRYNGFIAKLRFLKSFTFYKNYLRQTFPRYNELVTYLVKRNYRLGGSCEMIPH